MQGEPISHWLTRTWL